MTEVFLCSTELTCYAGALLSAFIARNLFKMEHLSFVNKAFLLYFFLDGIFGFIETHFLFKLYRER